MGAVQPGAERECEQEINAGVDGVDLVNELRRYQQYGAREQCRFGVGGAAAPTVEQGDRREGERQGEDLGRDQAAWPIGAERDEEQGAEIRYAQGDDGIDDFVGDRPDEQESARRAFVQAIRSSTEMVQRQHGAAPRELDYLALVSFHYLTVGLSCGAGGHAAKRTSLLRLRLTCFFETELCPFLASMNIGSLKSR